LIHKKAQEGDSSRASKLQNLLVQFCQITFYQLQIELIFSTPKLEFDGGFSLKFGGGFVPVTVGK
jgi:hypothetical protein